MPVKLYHLMRAEMPPRVSWPDFQYCSRNIYEPRTSSTNGRPPTEIKE